MSLNKVLLLGHVGKDPDIFHFQNGGSIASFSLATTERGFKTRDGKEVPPRTVWHNIRLSNGLATIAEQYIKKGTFGNSSNQSNDNRFPGQPVNNISAPVDHAGSADDINPKDDLPF